jgi:hypothetical protein
MGRKKLTKHFSHVLNVDAHYCSLCGTRVTAAAITLECPAKFASTTG